MRSVGAEYSTTVTPAMGHLQVGHVMIQDYLHLCIDDVSQLKDAMQIINDLEKEEDMKSGGDKYIVKIIDIPVATISKN